MFMRNLVLAFAATVCFPVLADEAGPGLGEAVTAARLEAIDFTIMPDGDGLPDGSGDAIRGREVYQRHCLACHGEAGTDGVNDRLAGGHGSMTSDNPVKTVGSYWPYATTVFDYVRRAMPYQAPGTLSHDEIYAVTAYLLYINDIVDEDTVLSAGTLPGIVMPNRDNFEWAYGSE
jgi:cytochrome c